METFDGCLLLQWLAYVIIGIGVLGGILPLGPGPVLVWLGALLWAWADHFQRVAWPTLIVLTLLMLAGGAAEAWMSVLGARRGGASWWALLAGLGLGMVGLVFFSLPGGIVGALAGILMVEARRSGGLRAALKSGGGFLVGYLLSALVGLGLSVIMLAIFAWQVMRAPS